MNTLRVWKFKIYGFPSNAESSIWVDNWSSQHPPPPHFLTGITALQDPAQSEHLEILRAPWCHSLSVLTDTPHKASPCWPNRKHTSLFLVYSFLLLKGRTTLFVTLKYMEINQCINVTGQIPSLDLIVTHSEHTHNSLIRNLEEVNFSTLWLGIEYFRFLNIYTPYFWTIRRTGP